MELTNLDTPRVIIDLTILDQNIQDMQSYCNKNGIRFRPHIKTHKITEIAHAQLRAGAKGITCQKIGEAEVMAEAGIEDILIYYNVMGQEKLKRLARLARRINISVAVDSEKVVKELGETAKQENCMIGVLIDCDTGFHRTGVQSPEESLHLAKLILSYENLRFLGLGTFPYTEESAAWFQQAKSIFQSAAISIPTISGGSSRIPSIADQQLEFTEMRAGTYVFYDWSSVKTGIATVGQCAARVIATVVSRQSETLFTLDAGSKTLSSDSGYMSHGNGYGYILEYPEAKIYALSEEHGQADFSDCENKPEIGEQISIIPNHVCGMMNMHDEVFAVRNGKLDAIWKVSARGKIR